MPTVAVGLFGLGFARSFNLVHKLNNEIQRKNSSRRNPIFPHHIILPYPHHQTLLPGPADPPGNLLIRPRIFLGYIVRRLLPPQCRALILQTYCLNFGIKSFSFFKKLLIFIN